MCYKVCYCSLLLNFELQGGFDITDAFLRREGNWRPKPAGGRPRAAGRSMGILANLISQENHTFARAEPERLAAPGGLFRPRIAINHGASRLIRPISRRCRRARPGMGTPDGLRPGGQPGLRGLVDAAASLLGLRVAIFAPSGAGDGTGNS